MQRYTEELKRFRQKEAFKTRKICDYHFNRRKNYADLHRDTQSGMAARDAMDWPAVSGEVRTLALTYLLGELEKMLPTVRRRYKSVSSVLLAPKRWAMDLREAHQVDIEAIRGDVRKALDGVNYLGVIEPGYYPERRKHPHGSKGLVLWHAHLMAWGPDRARLADAVAAINRTETSLLFGVAASNMRPRSWDTAQRVLAYMFKTPAKAYTTRRIPERVDADTGEIKDEHDKQYSRRLRPGEHVHMRNVLRELSLQELIVAGGDGERFAKGSLDRIARDRQNWEERRRMTLVR